jgi:hypothetical protein
MSASVMAIGSEAGRLPSGSTQMSDARRTADGADHPRARRQVGLVRGPPGVHELHEDRAAGRVDRVGHAPPTRDLRGVEEAGDARVAEPVGVGRGALGDDQAGAGALLVVGGDQLAGTLPSERLRVIGAITTRFLSVMRPRVKGWNSGLVGGVMALR